MVAAAPPLVAPPPHPPGVPRAHVGVKLAAPQQHRSTPQHRQGSHAAHDDGHAQHGSLRRWPGGGEGRVAAGAAIEEPSPLWASSGDRQASSSKATHGVRGMQAPCDGPWPRSGACPTNHAASLGLGRQSEPTQFLAQRLPVPIQTNANGVPPLRCWVEAPGARASWRTCCAPITPCASEGRVGMATATNVAGRHLRTAPSTPACNTRGAQHTAAPSPGRAGSSRAGTPATPHHTTRPWPRSAA